MKTAPIPEYFYRINEWLGVGGIGALALSNKDLVYGNDNEKMGSSHGYYMTLMPAVKADWLRRKHFGMYSKLALGVTLFSLQEKLDTGEKESGTAATANWQLSLVGLEAGGSKLLGFAELGFGEQGVGVIGLRYKF